MIIIEYNQVEIDFCLECGGCWLDQGELELLLEHPGRLVGFDVIQEAEKSKRRCPRCHAKLREMLFPETEVEVDICPRDGGIWLDRGELADIAASQTSTGIARKLQEYFGGVFHPQNQEE